MAIKHHLTVINTPLHGVYVRLPCTKTKTCTVKLLGKISEQMFGMYTFKYELFCSFTPLQPLFQLRYCDLIERRSLHNMGQCLNKPQILESSAHMWWRAHRRQPSVVLPSLHPAPTPHPQASLKASSALLCRGLQDLGYFKFIPHIWYLQLC